MASGATEAIGMGDTIEEVATAAAMSSGYSAKEAQKEFKDNPALSKYFGKLAKDKGQQGKKDTLTVKAGKGLLFEKDGKISKKFIYSSMNPIMAPSIYGADAVKG